MITTQCKLTITCPARLCFVPDTWHVALSSQDLASSINISAIALSTVFNAEEVVVITSGGALLNGHLENCQLELLSQKFRRKIRDIPDPSCS